MPEIQPGVLTAGICAAFLGGGGGCGDGMTLSSTEPWTLTNEPSKKTQAAVTCVSVANCC